MANSNSRKYIIRGSAAVLVGAILYMLWKKYRKPKEEKKPDETKVEEEKKEEKVNEKPVKDKGNPGGTPAATPTQAEIDLAIAYRIWANSTDYKIRTYGATSKYKLDKTSSNPYNSNFTDSYSAGKTEYDAFLKAIVDDANTIKKGDYVLVTTRGKQATYYGEPIAANYKGDIKSAPANYKYKVSKITKDSATGELMAYIFNIGDTTGGYANGTGFQIYTKYLKKTTF